MYKSQYTLKRKIEHFVADKPRLSRQFMKFTGSDDDFFFYSNLADDESLRPSKRILQDSIKH